MAEAKKEHKPAEQKQARKHSGTPSSIALAAVGEPPADASDVELCEHAARYAAAKKAARWG